MEQSQRRQLGEATNLVSHDIRNLFPVVEKLPRLEALIEKVQIDQYLEKTEDIYRLNLVSEQSAIEDLSFILKLDDPNLKAIAWACLGGVHTFNGNYQKAFAAFSVALDQQAVHDVKSYIFTELSNLLRKLGYTREAISVLQSALAATTSEKLVWRIRTYSGLCRKYSQTQSALSILKESENHYRDVRDSTHLALVLRHTASIYTYLQEYGKAREYIDQTMAIAMEHDLINHQYAAINEMGWMFIQQGEMTQARSLFKELIMKNLPPYDLSLALQNLGYLEYECGNYRDAIRYHGQSLRITTQYDMRDMAFEDYYKLGLCHEKVGEIGLADHFYSQGYAELQKEIDLGLRIMDYRKKLLNAYVDFLWKNQKISDVQPKNEIFGFAVGKPLREIRDIFHTGLLTLHLERTKNAPQLCRMLRINTRTYFLYQKKLGLKRGEVKKGPYDNPYLKQYLESLLALSWRDANRQFEADLYAYLLTKYQYNKTKLAEALKVSYQQVIQKTK